MIYASLFIILSCSLQFKYGRPCQDINCPSGQKCVIAEDPCESIIQKREKKCGTFPTCISERQETVGKDCSTFRCPLTHRCFMDGGIPKCVPGGMKKTGTIKPLIHSTNKNLNPTRITPPIRRAGPGNSLDINSNKNWNPTTFLPPRITPPIRKTGPGNSLDINISKKFSLTTFLPARISQPVRRTGTVNFIDFDQTEEFRPSTFTSFRVTPIRKSGEVNFIDFDETKEFRPSTFTSFRVTPPVRKPGSRDPLDFNPVDTFTPSTFMYPGLTETTRKPGPRNPFDSNPIETFTPSTYLYPGMTLKTPYRPKNQYPAGPGYAGGKIGTGYPEDYHGSSKLPSLYGVQPQQPQYFPNPQYNQPVTTTQKSSSGFLSGDTAKILLNLGKKVLSTYINNQQRNNNYGYGNY